MSRIYDVKIYSAHDCDLYSLHLLYKFNFSKAIYCSLNAFLKKQAVVIKLPPKRKHSIKKRRICATKLILDEVKNAEMIAFLDGISPGYRNNFLKNILRVYLSVPCTEEFFSTPELYAKAEKLLKPIREGRKQINAAEKKYNHEERRKQTPLKPKLLVEKERTKINKNQVSTQDTKSMDDRIASDRKYDSEINQPDAKYVFPDKIHIPVNAEPDRERTEANKVENQKKNDVNPQDVTNILFNIINS